MAHSKSKSDRIGRERSTSRDAGLATLATRQFGVVHVEQLHALGLSAREIHMRVSRGHLHKLHPGVYAVGHVRLVPHARLLAALLTCGPASFLSHRTAAAIWGLRAVNTKRIDVSVPRARLRRREGLVIHRCATPHPEELATRNGLRVSSVARLLVESAPAETPRELDRLITQAVRKQVLDLEATERALARHTRRPGIARLRTAMRDYRPRPDSKSDLEDAFAELIAGTDAWVRNVTIDGWELDFYLPRAKLAVELDGRPYHVAVRDMEKDKFKDGKLLLKGIRTLRITDMRLRVEPEAVRDDVLRLAT